jgi:hypothetical protein
MSAKGRPTPGPWRACKAGECQCGMIWSTPTDSAIVTAYGEKEYGSAEFVIASAHSKWGDNSDMVYGVVPEADREANACLIAAAPDLLAAAEWALETIDGNYHELSVELEAAIAKAKGAAS